MEDFVKKIGVGAFDARLKRMADAMTYSIRAMYKTLNIDIEPNRYLVLTLIKNIKSISVVEIAQRMGFAHQSIDNITKKMISSGYLIRYKDVKDKRRTIFELTNKAEDILPQLENIWNIGEDIFQDIVPNSEVILNQLELIEEELKKSSFGDRIVAKLNKDKNE